MYVYVVAVAEVLITCKFPQWTFPSTPFTNHHVRKDKSFAGVYSVSCPEPKPKDGNTAKETQVGIAIFQIQ